MSMCPIVYFYFEYYLYRNCKCLSIGSQSEWGIKYYYIIILIIILIIIIIIIFPAAYKWKYYGATLAYIKVVFLCDGGGAILISLFIQS